MTVKQINEINKAFAEGKAIQLFDAALGRWMDTFQHKRRGEKYFTFSPNTKYRVSPEYLYRPFADEEEMEREMEKHEPYRLIAMKNYPDKRYVTRVTPEGVIIVKIKPSDEVCFPASFEGAFKKYAFPDGTPFGVRKKVKR